MISDRRDDHRGPSLLDQRTEASSDNKVSVSQPVCQRRRFGILSWHVLYSLGAFVCAPEYALSVLGRLPRPGATLLLEERS